MNSRTSVRWSNSERYDRSRSSTPVRRAQSRAGSSRPRAMSIRARSAGIGTEVGEEPGQVERLRPARARPPAPSRSPLARCSWAAARYQRCRFSGSDPAPPAPSPPPGAPRRLRRGRHARAERLRETDVQVAGHRQRDDRLPAGCLQSAFVEAAGLVGTATAPPHLAQRRRSQPSSSARLPAAARLRAAVGEGLDRRREVPRAPSGSCRGSRARLRGGGGPAGGPGRRMRRAWRAVSGTSWRAWATAARYTATVTAAAVEVAGLARAVRTAGGPMAARPLPAARLGHVEPCVDAVEVTLGQPRPGEAGGEERTPAQHVRPAPTGATRCSVRSHGVARSRAARARPGRPRARDVARRRRRAGSRRRRRSSAAYQPAAARWSRRTRSGLPAVAPERSASANRWW